MEKKNQKKALKNNTMRVDVQVNYKRLFIDFLTDIEHNITQEESLVWEKINELPADFVFSFEKVNEIHNLIRNYVDFEFRYMNLNESKVYDIKFILKVINEQKRNSLSNISICNKYKLSRNTLTKWKRIFDETMHK